MRKLKKNEIEVKVKKVTAKGCLLLLYKTARVDMQMLDEEFGSKNWACDYKTINGVLYCGIGVYYGGDWVYKWDCGIESREDGEGNEKKGEASDAFKRAGFKWGIGRELYSAPFIWANVPTEKDGDKYVLKDKSQKFIVKEIDYNEDGEISYLIIVDNKNNMIFNFGKEKKEEKINNVGTKKIELPLTAEMKGEIDSCRSADELAAVCQNISKELGDEEPKYRKALVSAYKAKLAEVK